MTSKCGFVLESRQNINRLIDAQTVLHKLHRTIVYMPLQTQVLPLCLSLFYRAWIEVVSYDSLINLKFSLISVVV